MLYIMMFLAIAAVVLVSGLLALQGWNYISTARTIGKVRKSDIAAYNGINDQIKDLIADHALMRATGAETQVIDDQLIDLKNERDQLHSRIINKENR